MSSYTPVEVITAPDENGQLLPKQIICSNNRTYSIKRILHMLEQPNPQFAVIKAAIYQSVSNKYSVAEMDTSGEFTALLIDHFEQIEHVDNLNLELLIKTVERISVKKNGEIIVTFINKATIESEENSNGTST